MKIKIEIDTENEQDLATVQELLELLRSYNELMETMGKIIRGENRI